MAHAASVPTCSIDALPRPSSPDQMKTLFAIGGTGLPALEPLHALMDG
jgi:hypothetical protein